MKNNEYLTIAEFAKQAGVTKQAVYLRLNKDLKPYLKELEGVKCLNIKALELYGTKPLEQDPSRTLIDLAAYLEGQNKRFDKLIDVLEEDNAKLHQELEIKNEQIKKYSERLEDLSNRLAESSQLLNQQQKLNAHALISLQEQDPAPVNQDEIDAAYKRGLADQKEELRSQIHATMKEYYYKGYEKCKEENTKKMIRIAKALSGRYPSAADYLIRIYKED